jgi:hypothetical protein
MIDITPFMASKFANRLFNSSEIETIRRTNSIVATLDNVMKRDKIVFVCLKNISSSTVKNNHIVDVTAEHVYDTFDPFFDFSISGVCQFGPTQCVKCPVKGIVSYDNYVLIVPDCQTTIDSVSMLDGCLIENIKFSATILRDPLEIVYCVFSQLHSAAVVKDATATDVSNTVQSENAGVHLNFVRVNPTPGNTQDKAFFENMCSWAEPFQDGEYIIFNGSMPIARVSTKEECMTYMNNSNYDQFTMVNCFLSDIRVACKNNSEKDEVSKETEDAEEETEDEETEEETEEDSEDEDTEVFERCTDVCSYRHITPMTVSLGVILYSIGILAAWLWNTH